MREFEELLNSMVREIANPELPGGFDERVWSRLNGEEVMLKLTTEVSTESVFASLWESVRALVSPRRLTPLVLKSQPLAVVDRMASERNSRSMLGAVLAHVVVILVIGWVVEARTGVVSTIRPVEVVALDAPLPKLPPRSSAAGGGGGQQSPTPVTQGHLPKFTEQQIVPPMTAPLEEPRIAIDPTVEVQKDLKMANNSLPNLGLPNSPLVGMSLGGGHGTGIGSGNGSGIGPGMGGGAGGGLHHVGGGVSEPQVLFQPEPEFSEEARKAKFSGDVMVYLWVDEHGNPTHVRLARGVGLGLDEKAMEAVRQYKFRPAMENGKPVTVEMYVDVDFHVF